MEFLRVRVEFFVKLGTFVLLFLSFFSFWGEGKRPQNEKNEKNLVEDADKIVDELWYAFNEGRRVRRLRSCVSHIS